MGKTIEKIEMMTLPCVPLYGVVPFPTFKQSVEISKSIYKTECSKAKQNGDLVVFVPVKDVMKKTVDSAQDLYPVGTVVRIKEYLKLPDEALRIIFEGESRAEITSVKVNSNGRITADVLCKYIEEDDIESIKSKALIRETIKEFKEFAKFLPKLSEEVKLAIENLDDAGLLADFISANVLITFEDKLEILNEFDPQKRLEKLILILDKETRLFQAELDIHKKVARNLEENQREHYLREQVRVIQQELGDDEDDEIAEYGEKIFNLKASDEVKEKLFKEVSKLKKMPYTSAESSVIRLYLDTCLELPWNVKTKDRNDIDAARKILERDHDGLEKVKERILEFLSVKKLNPDLKNQIICLYGPPGTGKTSIAHSIADAMKRKYVRVSLGGIRDEADIRGHRKTYIGSMPGRIINGLVQAGSSNPVMLLDEIDKLTHDSHGDPASALLEVLDGEQNKNFRDHFVELPFDLSDVLFIATANELDTVPRPLLDRMEVIELHTYTRNEKLSIAKHHLIPKQLKRHGLKKTQLLFDDSAILEIADNYTRESGVRELERKLGSVCRKVAMKIVEGEFTKIKLNDKNIGEYLYSDRIIPDKIYDSDEIGTVNGLAYTQAGGDLLRIECAVMPGTGKIELTGSLGDVMKESAQAAVSYVRQHTQDFGIDEEFYKNKDIHIHVPEGAVPKDGPSAGVTLVTALVSELTGIAVKRDIAMTGEVTLRGRVLPIGGLREKTMAAYKAGVNTVIIPADNKKDLEKVDKKVKESLTFLFADRVEYVLENALVSSPFSRKTSKSPRLPDGIISLSKSGEVSSRTI